MTAEETLGRILEATDRDDRDDEAIRVALSVGLWVLLAMCPAGGRVPRAKRHRRRTAGTRRRDRCHRLDTRLCLA